MEQDLLTTLDFCPEVIALREQPFTLTYMQNLQECHYTPDVMAEFGGEGITPHTVVYEVKPAQVLRARWAQLRPRLRAATAYCRERGWKFRLMTESRIRTPFLQNAKLLRRYVNIPIDDTMRQELWLTLLALGRTNPQALLEAAYWSQEKRMAALPILWNMVATRQVGADLSHRLTMASPIWRWQQ